MSARLFILAVALAGLALFPATPADARPGSTNAPNEDVQLPKNLPSRLREKMANMPPAERQKLLERWQQFRDLPAEQRKQANLNFQKFRNMSPQEREQLKQRLQQWQNMSPEEKKRLHENFQRWKQFSPQEREEMRKRHAQRPPAAGDAPSGGPLAPAVKAVPAASQSP